MSWVARHRRLSPPTMTELAKSRVLSTKIKDTRFSAPFLRFLAGVHDSNWSPMFRDILPTDQISSLAPSVDNKPCRDDTSSLILVWSS